MKKSTTTKYLLIDYGNTCVKAGIYSNGKLSNRMIESNSIDFKLVLKKLRITKFDKVIFLGSARPIHQDNFIRQIKKYCKNIHVVTKKDFKKVVDLSNIKKNVVIGNDILLSAYYLARNFKKAAILCLGTVFYLVVVDRKKIISVDLIPNVLFGLEQVSKITTIPDSLIPEIFDKTIGLNTIDAFKSGARNMMEGYLDLVAKRFKLGKGNIIVTGGGAYKYQSLDNKFTFTPYMSLKALGCLTKYKKW